MKKNTRDYHKVKKFSEGGMVDKSDGYETARQVNVGAKENKGGDARAYPGTDDNMFFASGSDEKIIRAKRELRNRLKDNK